jgi:hypothetical protein
MMRTVARAHFIDVEVKLFSDDDPLDLTGFFRQAAEVLRLYLVSLDDSQLGHAWLSC